MSNIDPTSLDSCLASASKAAGMKLGTTEKMQTIIATVSYIAMGKFCTKVLGVAGGLTKLDTSGERWDLNVLFCVEFITNRVTPISNPIKPCNGTDKI